MDINRILTTISSGCFLSQVLTMVFLTALGYVFIWACCSVNDRIRRMLLSFPAGLAYYSAVVYSMLVVKIRISKPRLIFVALFAFITVAAAVGFFKKKRGRAFLPSFKDFFLKDFLILLVLSALIAAVSSSGLLSVILDNDSYYYYSTYPQMIIKEGDLKYEFDVLLTDVGPIAAVINTLPFVFGFLTSFGIQHFLNVVFILTFIYALHTELKEGLKLKKGSRTALALCATVFLGSCPAYLTTAKWIMAGDYFMVYYFLLAYLGYRQTKKGEEDMSALLMLFTVMTTMLRQEGPVMTAFLIVCFCMLGYSALQLSILYIMPAIIAAAYYYLRIFVFLGVRPLYAFLTRQKAVYMILMLLALLAGIFLLQCRIFEKIRKHLALFITGTAIAVNIAALAINPERYLTNLYMLLMNIRLRNGWGYFGYVFFVLLILLLVLTVRYRQYELSFFDVLMMGYLLVAVCAAWGRGDHLRLGVGDSGNRVLLTAVPLIVFAMSLRFGRIMDAER